MSGQLVAMAAGAALATAPLLLITALRDRRASAGESADRENAAGDSVAREATVRAPSALGRRLGRWIRAVRAAADRPGTDRTTRRVRTAGWVVGGLVVWVLSGWPIAGIAVSVAGLWAPWLLGSARVVHERIDRLEALETWCRRMADVLAGGGTVGLTQAITTSAGTAAAYGDERIAAAVTTLGRRLREASPVDQAVREFADLVDDRVGDTVAAALWLALHQQSSGVAQVLRQLADGVARDVRERRRIEAERAESRQSIRMLLLIQAGVLAMIAFVPTFADAYATPAGQLVMTVLLAATLALLVWMRRLALGRPAPRFLTGPNNQQRADSPGSAARGGAASPGPGSAALARLEAPR